MQNVILKKSWSETSKILLFTGQGSQFIGMGRNLLKRYPYLHYIYDEVDEAVQFKLSKTIFEGEKNELLDTKKVQPALLAHAAAILDVLKHEYHFSLSDSNITSVAGHSVGEFIALYVSSSLSLYDASKLLKFRGEIIQTITDCEKEDCRMLAMLFGDESKLIQLSKEMNEKSNYIVDVGNINSPKQIVLSGHKEGLIIAESLALQRKYCKKTKFLDILYPFHSSILTPCAPIFKEYLESIPLHDGKIDILSNYTSKPMIKKEDIIPNCSSQINHPVLWRQSIQSVYKNTDLFIEIGPQSVLKAFNKQINKDTQSISICNEQDIDDFKTLL